MKRYSFHSVHGDGWIGADYSFQFTSFTVTAAKIAEPTTTYTTPETYDGTAKTFDFTYDTPVITDYNSNVTWADSYNNIVTTVEAKDCKGGVIPASTYQLENHGADGTPTSVNGALKATEAGTYKVKYNLSAEAIANGVQWKSGGTSEKTFTFEIKRKGIAVPAVQGATQIYKAAEYEFGLNGYDKDIMSVASYTGNPTAAAITWDASTEKFKARDAATYTVKFHLDSLNYVWSVNGGESAEDQAKTVIINKKEIAINATPSANSNPKFGLGESGAIELTATASGITATEFALNLYYVKEGGTDQEITGINATALTLDVSQITSSGKYTLYVELTNAAANKNYRIAGEKFEMPFTIESGAIDTDALIWQYKAGDGSAERLFKEGSGATEQNELRYAVQYGAALQYTVFAYIPPDSYLSIDASYNSNGYKNGYKTLNAAGEAVQYADKAGTYTTYIVLNTDADHLFKTTANTDRITTDGLKGWYKIEWEISKGEIDITKLTWEYSLDGGATWNDVPADNNIGYNEGNDIYVRIKESSYAGSGLVAGDITYGGTDEAFGKGSCTTLATISPSDENLETPTAPVELQWNITNAKITVTGWNVNGTLIKNGKELDTPVVKTDETLSQYVKYVYTCTLPDGTEYSGEGFDALEYINEIAKQNNAKILVTVKAESNSGDYDIAGTNLTQSFTVGEQKKYVEVTVTGDGSIYGEVTLGVTAKYNGNDFAKKNYTILLYGKDADLDNLGTAAKELTPDRLNDPANYRDVLSDAGRYAVVIKLTDEARQSKFAIETPAVYFTVEPKPVCVPQTTKEITYSGDYIDISAYLDGNYDAAIMSMQSGYSNKNAGEYTVTFKLINGNYKWVEPETAATAKALAKATLTAGGITIDNSALTATLDWTINKISLKTDGWNTKGKEGATLNALASYQDMIKANDLDVQIAYRYYDTNGNALEEVEFKSGEKYLVEAYLTGADAGNFEFADGTDSIKSVTPQKEYTVPKSGMTAALSNVKGFVTKTWMGLPIWVWLLIGLAVVLFFIFLLILIAHRRKTKEKREEKKAAKEAAKAEAQAKAEAEKERREAEKARLESQREIEKMKAEAEIAKIKAQAQAQAPAPQAMPQAMPMPQMPQAIPQPMPMPAMPQQMPMQQQPQYQQMPVQQPVQQVQATPVQMPTVMPAQASQADMQAAEARIRAAEERARYAEERIARDAEERARQAEERALRAAEERARLAEQQAMRSAYMQQPNAMYIPSVPAQQSGNGSIPMDVLGALMVSALKNFAANGNHVAPAVPMEKPAELPQTVESDSATVSAQYPPDAVITTTTTVDTTKNGAKAAPRAEDDRERFFDIDGFYDKYEGK